MSGAASAFPHTDNEPVRPILWTEAEPARLARDLQEIAAYAPLLTYRPPDLGGEGCFPHGGWIGELPRWPFDRPEPAGLNEVIGERGLSIALLYSPAHPMLAPVIYPVELRPSLMEQTQTAWHVAPGGALCLIQSDGAWPPEASITDLLAKAAGWRIEYALMHAGVIKQMSVNGIVSDNSFDHLILEAVHRRSRSPESEIGEHPEDSDG